MATPILTATVTIVTDTNAYASGDYIGTTILSLADAGYIGGGVLHTIALNDASKQNAAIDLLFFSTACGSTTFTNNGALTVHATDVLTFIGHVAVVASDYSSLVVGSVATVRNIGLTFNPPASGKSIWVVPVCRGTPTYAASALQVKFAFLRD